MTCNTISFVSRLTRKCCRREFLDIFEDVCSLHTCCFADSFWLLCCITPCECSGRFFLRHPVYTLRQIVCAVWSAFWFFWFAFCDFFSFVWFFLIFYVKYTHLTPPRHIFYNVGSVPSVAIIIFRDVRILHQKNANSARHFCEFCTNSEQHFNPFFYDEIVCDTSVLSRVSWLVGPLKLRVTIQLTLSLRLLKMHCDYQPVSVLQAVVHFAEKINNKVLPASIYDTIRYDSVYLTCSKKLTGSQLSLPHGINKKLKCETKNKIMSVIGPV